MKNDTKYPYLKKKLIGAHYGLLSWLYQRLSALILVFFTLILFVNLLRPGNMSFELWRNLFSSGFMKLASVFSLLSLAVHAWVGIRDIWMDYIKPTYIRLILYIFSVSLIFSSLIFSFKILWDL